MKRLFTTACAVPLLCASAGMAQDLAGSDFSLSFGAMQRSYASSDTVIIGQGFVPIAESDDFEGMGHYFDARLTTPTGLVRVFGYYDEVEQDYTDPGGIGFNVPPAGIGLFGPGPFTGEFERRTHLARADLSQHVGSYGGLELYAGATIAHIGDHFDGLIDAEAFVDATNQVTFDGSSTYVGPTLSAVYSLPSAGSFSFDAFGSLSLLYGNHSMNYSAFSAVAFTDESANDRDSGWTGAAELGLTASYELSAAASLSLTYQVAFYGDAVHSPNSVGLTDRNGPVTTEVFTDSITFQGLSVGFNYTF